ncbi:acetyltransferase, GNAT family protein [Besnoitia besnoiti]|uniref:Acetyltransferase, GNAT family protein n=1 Tax=Besnoitia besnoiti TaxID=94643 RepID=A0A2A9MLW6_BESBE|nr:acetyltransferase, GNAT family protein [Besnoitia besnoiti]PFH36490.1 acetyltransferase, GNAT family protein [Besnoitia besnoiti]
MADKCSCSCKCCSDPAACQSKCDCSCKCCEGGRRGDKTCCGVRSEEATLFASSQEPVTTVTEERTVVEGDDGKGTVTSTVIETHTVFAPPSDTRGGVSSDTTITAGEAAAAGKQKSEKCASMCCRSGSCACDCKCCREKACTCVCCAKGKDSKTVEKTATSLEGSSKCPCCSSSEGACMCRCECCQTCSCSCQCCKDKKKCCCCTDKKHGTCDCSCLCCAGAECRCCNCCKSRCDCDCRCCKRAQTCACKCNCACCQKQSCRSATGGSCCASKASTSQKGAPNIRDRVQKRKDGSCSQIQAQSEEEGGGKDEVLESEDADVNMCTVRPRQDMMESSTSYSYFASPEAIDSVKCLTVKGGEQVVLRRMRVSDYSAVRTLLPSVSRCPETLSETQLAEILRLPVFYAWCCYSVRGEQGDGEGGGQERAIAEGELLGYCEVILQPHLGRKPDGRLERVVVSQTFRGRGLATKMCQEVIQQIRDAGVCGRLDLTVEKPDARHIYEDKLGFRAVDTSVLRLEL